MPGPREVLVTFTEANRLSLVKRIRSAHKLLKQIGSLLVADSREAFQLQRLGDIAWKPTYPKQTPPTINVAWTLKDFLAGRSKPDSRRFNNRPAGIATGQEQRQVAFRMVGEDTVEIGTTMEGALGMQTGKVTGRIPVTDPVKERLNDWLYTGKRKRMFFPDYITGEEMRAKFGVHWVKKGNKRSKGGTETITEYPNQVYESKLRRFLKPTMTEYEIKGYARPFLGVTQKRADTLSEMLQNHIAGRN